ncbi:cytochrome o ubiquinol oxidase subunit IV [Massilia arenosa]|uniref:Cytochrome bo(3) ubiquinol oxidase subunit 4 n=1 Tax=Zemynaea arenosa TaxID=2561931 RepID=A0A4Y9SDJ4_9BURK|nr:cytochrome o ubiquinol oxidase subunit IV [Massilia arenosa]TFW20824.1 cytochrome o ubiquinol oxidase subunit IV [Massilia arenosa]
MSAHDTHDHAHAHDHNGHGHDDHHDDHGSHPHVSFKGYMVGFVLSVILTAIPFWLVMHKVISSTSATALVILGIGAVQMVVHMIYFLHLTPSAEKGWTMLSTLFTIMMLVIVMSGSLWVMYHMNQNMMPGMHGGAGHGGQMEHAGQVGTGGQTAPLPQSTP